MKKGIVYLGEEKALKGMYCRFSLYKGSWRNTFSLGSVVKGGDNSFKLKEVIFRLYRRKIFFINESGETLKQIAQKSCGCPTTGGLQSGIEQGFEQPSIVEGVPVHSRGFGLDDH